MRKKNKTEKTQNWVITLGQTLQRDVQLIGSRLTTGLSAQPTESRTLLLFLSQASSCSRRAVRRPADESAFLLTHSGNEGKECSLHPLLLLTCCILSFQMLFSFPSSSRFKLRSWSSPLTLLSFFYIWFDFFSPQFYFLGHCGCLPAGELFFEGLQMRLSSYSWQTKKKKHILWYNLVFQ